MHTAHLECDARNASSSGAAVQQRKGLWVRCPGQTQTPTQVYSFAFRFILATNTEYRVLRLVCVVEGDAVLQANRVLKGEGGETDERDGEAEGGGGGGGGEGGAREAGTGCLEGRQGFTYLTL